MTTSPRYAGEISLGERVEYENLKAAEGNVERLRGRCTGGRGCDYQER